MKANEFVKKFGIREAKIALLYCKSASCGTVFYKNIQTDTRDLKRLIKSHKLVEHYGGLEEANRIICDAYKGSIYEIPKGHEELSLAIQDVESCL